jgi:hypothetical protein
MGVGAILSRMQSGGGLGSKSNAHIYMQATVADKSRPVYCGIQTHYKIFFVFLVSHSTPD